MKTVNRELGADDMFLLEDTENEIALLKTIRHPNIVLFFGAGVFANGIFAGYWLGVCCLNYGDLLEVLHTNITVLR